MLSGEASTRLLARVIFDPPGARLGKALIGHALALGDLVMMRKQLLTLKALAERDATGHGCSPSSSPSTTYTASL